MQKVPRGIRNNNPGNIRHGDSWVGLAPQQSDGSFCVFLSPEYGIRAMAKLLRTYQKRYNLNTVAALIRRWAPPVENNTAAYVRIVAKALGVGEEEWIDVTEKLPLLIPAIIKHENGYNPYDPVVIERGIAMALVS